MKVFIALLLIACTGASTSAASAQIAADRIDRIKLQLNTEEAEAVLAIVSQHS
jgi:hypothetical protein